MMADLRERSSVELRLDLAEAQAERVKSWRGACLKRDRIAAITNELIRRGSF